MPESGSTEEQVGSVWVWTGVPLPSIRFGGDFCCVFIDRVVISPYGFPGRHFWRDLMNVVE
jgi:hypothetical protein